MVELEGKDHRIASVNAAFCQLVGLGRAEILGRAFHELVFNGRACVPLLDKIYETGAAALHVAPSETQDEGTYWLYAMWPTLDGDERPARVVVQLTKSAHYRPNVTAVNEALLISALRQHELREAAEKANLELAAEMIERKRAATALHEALDHLRASQTNLEQASQAKDDFLAALSHELRTPLAPVLLAAGALQHDSRLPADVREQIGLIEGNIAIEARLIDDLLDLTRISHRKLQLRIERCDVHALIAHAMQIISEEARAKDLTILCNLEARRSGLDVDPVRFRQVIWNLLRNAVKFTPRGGRVTIGTTDFVNESTHWLRIYVEDTGRGIEPARLERIFQPFDQGGLVGRQRFGGLGLGLAIARSVVHEHGGRIHALSEGPDRGATFVIEFPDAKQPPSGAVDRALPTSQAIRPLRLLVVEDHASTLQVLVLVLRRDGHRVVSATTVTEALGAAARDTFDLVISDLGLPDGSGIELMQQLRSRHGLAGIALSGYGMEEDVARSRAAGFQQHLIKPVQLADLRRAVASFASN